MIVFLEAQGTNAYNRLLDNSEWIFGYYKLNVLTLARIITIMYDFLTCAHIQISVLFYFLKFLFLFYLFLFFLSSLLDYRFPYCIQLYTWSTQQPTICGDSLRRLILQCSALSIISNYLY